MSGVEQGQFTPAGGERLQVAAAGLAAALQDHAAFAAAMRGGTSEQSALAELNDRVTAAAIEWTDAAYTHTGTFVLPLEVEQDDLPYEDDSEEHGEQPAVQARLSLVSRWDLDVSDLAKLITDGRAAHRRARPRESEEDAVVAIGDENAAQALYAILDEAGEPLLRIDGLDVVRGSRLYIAAEQDWDYDDDLDYDPDLLPMTVQPPAGPIVYSEAW
jgi:hypothetical protein